MATLYTLDTNLYVDASRSDAEYAALRSFSESVVSRLYVTGIVAQELRAGARPPEMRALDRDVLGPFVRRGRVVAPSYAQWDECGDVMRRLAASGPPVADMTKALVNDVHLALTCRAHGLRLVTRNVRDFARIAPLVPGFAFDAPWPSA